MIKVFFETSNIGKRVAVLGLSDENIKKLVTGQPILINFDELLPGVNMDVCVFHGKTEEDMLQDLKDHGLNFGAVQSEVVH